MALLIHQRCLNHAVREAVARCPQCRQFFCRECITEHEDRVICAACLTKLTQSPAEKRRRFTGALRIVACSLGILLAWFFFYLVGDALLSMPASFHEGTLWQEKWDDFE